jgi:hypothetical protein
MSNLETMASQDIIDVINEFLAKSVPISCYQGKRTSGLNSIVFENGWVASIVPSGKREARYSVAVCDYNGYFDWEVLRKYGSKNGCLCCNTGDELRSILTIIESL